ncbi:ABC transporter ATP-binding protein [Microbacterium panaciterrae]|uniref:ABC transporter ATP-binding protein n=1 Tax=Microbacterium panaciterrae TaxID=985759 RepID=A0ABP8P187_9MICO
MNTIQTAEPVLRVRDLITTFHTEEGAVNAVRGVSFDVAPGEVLALVGESGSGKSVTAMSILNMVRRPGRVEGGSVEFDGRDLLSLSESEQRSIRGSGIGMIFQDPVGSLNPLMRVRDQLVEAIQAHEPVDRKEAERRSVQLLADVGIPDPEARMADYPLAFSGGMSQRVMIAMALANKPKLIIADEPTTALDVTIQAQILELLATLGRDHGTAVLLITHNLGVVARACDRIAVMYAGKIVETGPVGEVFATPGHPYTRDLLGATPSLDRPRALPLVAIDGRPPSLRTPPRGCAYAARDPRAFDRCFVEDPALVADQEGRQRACWLPLEAGTVAPRESTEADASPAEQERTEPILEVRDVKRSYPAGKKTLLGRRRRVLRAVDGVSFSIHDGETVGLIGESGCGKSTLGRLILGIESPSSGDILFRGRSIVGRSPGERRTYNQDVQLVFQNPMSSLNPRMTIGQSIGEALRAAPLKDAARRSRVHELLELVGMEASAEDRFPHEFSGGQRQRVVIARALAVNPQLVVLDEAVAALDVSLQAQVINLLRDLQRRIGLSYLFIGHDLATVRHISDRIIVMYLGEIVEMGDAEQITAAPLHPYTASLISAVPEPDPARERTAERIVLTGEVPTPIDPPAGCRFHTRCPIGPMHRDDRGICGTHRPALQDLGDGRKAACHFPGELSAVGAEAAPAALPASGLGPVRRTGGAGPADTAV